MSVRRAREEIDAEEFANWLAYFDQETSDVDGFHQAGIICATMVNLLGNHKVVPADFMPLKEKRKPGLKPKQAQATLAAMFGDK